MGLEVTSRKILFGISCGCNCEQEAPLPVVSRELGPDSEDKKDRAMMPPAF